ncbi:MAG: TetR/AcrR family transcriptional regulator [Ruminococcaceae bacterium]|nr:TetR/AcrR family transcriptional regulator [Oscillospiraceae bacterium]
MPRNVERDARELARRKQRIAETAFTLFAERSIESVLMTEIAEACEISEMTLYRHFASKDELVVAVSKWAMDSFTRVNRRKSPEMTGTAAETYALFLDSFLRMYREHSDILRFNQYFNIYIKSRRVGAEQMQPYSGMIDAIRERFHAVYLCGQEDGTLRTDVAEEKMFSATLHLMLAVVTRYAVGLAYETDVDPMEELTFQRDMLLQAYTKQ